MITNSPYLSFCRNCRYECRYCLRAITTNEIEKIKEKTKILAEALEFYSKLSPYHKTEDVFDGGFKARKALAQWENKK